MGRKALAWGILAQSLPDIDAIASFWLPPAEDVCAHRTLTHSLLFAVLAALLLSLLIRQWHYRDPVNRRQLFGFFLLQLLVHDLIDTCNAYGTGLLEPFSHHRFSFNCLYVADPLFSLPLLLAAIILLSRTARPYHRRLTLTCMGLPILYLCICIANKQTASGAIRQTLTSQHIAYKDFFTTPTPFNNLLWYGVVQTDSGYYVTHRSVFDGTNQPARFSFFKKNEYLLADVADDPGVQKLQQFAQGYYTVDRWGDTLVFNVLRFGQMLGWQDPGARFAFHYYLNPGYDNNLVVQRGRFTGWNSRTLHIYWQRIRGSIQENKSR
jgi:inner membrane protein